MARIRPEGHVDAVVVLKSVDGREASCPLVGRDVEVRPPLPSGPSCHAPLLEIGGLIGRRLLEVKQPPQHCGVADLVET